MRVKYIALPVILGASLGNSDIKKIEQREPTAIVDSHRLPSPDDIHVLYRGKSDSGQPYLVSMDKNAKSDLLSVKAYFGKLLIGKVNLRLKQYRDFDISPFLGVSSDGIEMIFRFGDYRTQCFVNDDGRDRVTVWFFRNEKPELKITSFENC